MSVEVEKGNLSLNQVIANKNELATIEGDCIVPDVKPDIMSIIGTSGIVSVYKTEVADGKVRIDGNVSVYVMYSGSDGESSQVRSINHVLDFSQIISVPDAKADMNNLGEVTLQSIDCKMVNERKINIKANLNFEVKLCTTSNVEFVNNVNLSDLQKIDTKVNVNSVLGMGSTKTSVNETVQIDSTDNLAEILKANCNVTNIDTKVSYNKVLIKADVNFKMLYSTEDGRFNTAKSTFPVMGFVDMADVSDDNVINTNVEIKNAVIKPNGSQDHSVSVDMEIGMSIIVFANQELSIVKDMYSPSKNLSFSQKSVEALQNAHTHKSTMNFNQKELLDIGDEKVYDIDTCVMPNDVRVMENCIEFSGTVRFTFVHSTNKMTGLASKTIDVPVDYRIPCDGMKQGADAKVRCDVNNENFNIMPSGEVELRMDIIFTVNSSNSATISLIDNIEETENDNTNDFNMVIYYTRDSDNLWNIAKEFRTTMPAIMKENNLENENLEAGMQLFISRYAG